MADVSELNFPLIPNEEGLSAEEDLAAAVASALTPGGAQAVAEPPPRPFGTTWAFDFQNRQMIRRGGRPALVLGLDALRQRCLMAVYSARFAHKVFSDGFGIDRPYQMIGLAVPTPVVLDYERRLRQALEALEGVAEVTEYEGDYDPGQGVFTCTFTVVSDAGQQIPFDGLRLIPID